MKKLLFIALILSLALSGTAHVYAQACTNCNLSYVPLEPIPNVTTGAQGAAVSFPQLLDNLYTILITVGALFSVLMLTISGIRYMMSDIVTDKARAIKRIQACIYGLLLIAASWLILNTINPKLVTFSLTPCYGNCATGNATPANPSTTPPPSSASTGGTSVIDSNGTTVNGLTLVTATAAQLNVASQNLNTTLGDDQVYIYDPTQLTSDQINNINNTYQSNCEQSGVLNTVNSVLGNSSYYQVMTAPAAIFGASSADVALVCGERQN